MFGDYGRIWAHNIKGLHSLIIFNENKFIINAWYIAIEITIVENIVFFNSLISDSLSSILSLTGFNIG